MRIITTCFFFFILVSYIRVSAQQASDAKSPRILILLDESSSMLDDWTPGHPRYNAARNIILSLMDSVYEVNPDVEFSLRVFGHQHVMQEKDCHDTRNEVMFSRNNITQMMLRLESIQPLGVTPIAYSLKEAAENDLVNENRYAYSIVLITDGGESCGGNICDVVKTLVNKKIFFKPYIVSLIDDGSLRNQYSCMGEYLQATKPNDIPKTIGTIVEAYRPMLRMEAAPPQPSQAPKPIPVVTTIDLPKTPTPAPPKDTTPVVATPRSEPVKPVIKTSPLLEATTKISIRTKLHPLKIIYPPVFVYIRPLPPAPPIKILEDEPVIPPRVAETAVKLIPRKPARYRLLYLEAYLEPRKLPAVPPIKILDDEPIATVPQAPKPAPPTPPAPKPATPKPPVTSTPASEKPAPTTVTSEQAEETTVSVYFTNGRGKYYHTTPQILLTDVTTGQPVKKFYRTIDANGNPDPQTGIPAGNYIVSVVGRNGTLKGSKVTIKEKNKNRIDIVVTSGSLQFQYRGAPDKPINDFSAVVVQRQVAAGKVIKQKCSAQLQYEPGNYYIEVNTLPVTRRNVEIDFGTTLLEIDQPGYVQFTNQQAMGTIKLLQTLGDSFAAFYNMEIPGNPELQKLRLQPGAYQARFRNPKVAYGGEIIVLFKVKSNAITEVELK